jgi:hypothetical protein
MWCEQKKPSAGHRRKDGTKMGVILFREAGGVFTFYLGGGSNRSLRPNRKLVFAPVTVWILAFLNLQAGQKPAELPLLAFCCRPYHEKHQLLFIYAES